MPLDYVRKHWQGQQSLFWSFWINLVVLRTGLILIERYYQPEFVGFSWLSSAAFALYFLTFHFLMFGWQVKGVMGSCDHYLQEFGSSSVALAVNMGIALNLLITLIVVSGTYQALFIHSDRMERRPPGLKQNLLGDYSLTLAADNTQILLKGDFRIGITQELVSLIIKTLSVKTIVLDSGGGRVTEGRGVAKAIAKHKLNTYVSNRCSSACITAFLGGVVRVLGKNGKLGFHQFVLDGPYTLPNSSATSAQSVDLEFYAGQGVSSRFLEKAFQAPHTDIWYPKPVELLESGVIHKFETSQIKD
jgi:hypothetical protein